MNEEKIQKEKELLPLSVDDAMYRLRVGQFAAQDPQLSWHAKGLISYFLSVPLPIKVNLHQLTRLYKGTRRGNTLASVRESLLELKEKGYVSHEKTQTANGLWSGCYDLIKEA